jgi:two-component system, chemotaxis family, protein-glutamate methylesterase/glutaminase
VGKSLRVFIVDDSTLARVTLRQVLGHDASVEVVGEARSGMEALRTIPLAAPDVVLMDMIMPGMDGLQTARELMATFPRPILIVSDLLGREAELNFKALQSGALDVARKPTAVDRDSPEAVQAFVRKLRILAGVPVVTRHWQRVAHLDGAPSAPHIAPPVGVAQLVLIGASTGGPMALHQLLTAMDGAIRAPIVIVQHMTRGFTAGMVRWLASAMDTPVELAVHGGEPRGGVIHVAPDDAQLSLRAGRFILEPDATPAQHCPSVDRLFESVARSPLASSTVAALLTGMGADGARGLLALREAGAWTIAQDEATSVVYGMPKAAADMGAACEVLPLGRIAPRLVQACAQDPSSVRQVAPGRPPLARGKGGGRE